MNLRTYLRIKTANMNKTALLGQNVTKEMIDSFQKNKVDPRAVKQFHLYGEDGLADPYTAAMIEDRYASNDAAEDYGFSTQPPFVNPETADTNPILLIGEDNDDLIDYMRNRTPEEVARGVNRSFENLNTWMRDQFRNNPLARRQDYIDAGYKSDPLKPLNRYFKAKGLHEVR